MIAQFESESGTPREEHLLSGSQVTWVWDLWSKLRLLFLCKRLVSFTMFNMHWCFFFLACRNVCWLTVSQWIVPAFQVLSRAFWKRPTEILHHSQNGRRRHILSRYSSLLFNSEEIHRNFYCQPDDNSVFVFICCFSSPRCLSFGNISVKEETMGLNPYMGTKVFY